MRRCLMNHFFSTLFSVMGNNLIVNRCRLGFMTIAVKMDVVLLIYLITHECRRVIAAGFEPALCVYSA